MMATTFSVGAALSRVRAAQAAPSRVVRTTARHGVVTAAAAAAARGTTKARLAMSTQQKRSSFASSSSAPLSAPAAAAAAAPQRRRRRGGLTTTASFSTYGGRGGGGGGIIPVPDRVVALLPYLVPLLDGLRYSRFFFAQFPQAIVLLQPIQPLASAYFRIPFAGMISFFAIYMGLAENRTMSRFVRFNAMQAIILDICMVGFRPRRMIVHQRRRRLRSIRLSYGFKLVNRFKSVTYVCVNGHASLRRGASRYGGVRVFAQRHERRVF